jgi:hypothetical protein
MAGIGVIVAGAFAKSPTPPPRTITVKVIADVSLRNNEIWKVDITSAMMDVSQTLQEDFKIKLKIKVYDYWAPGSFAIVDSRGGRRRQPKTLETVLIALNDHIRATGRGGYDVVIGLVPEGPDGPVNAGVADYLNGVVIIKYLNAVGGIKYVLLHEICHLFGAVDLEERGTVMSIRNPSFRIDRFTKAIMRVNRQRTFRPGECPLPEDRILEAIALYKERHVLGLGEDELAICLGKLQAMWDAKQ